MNFVFNQEYILVSLVCEVCIVLASYLLNKCSLYFAGTAKFLLMGHVINFTFCLFNKLYSVSLYQCSQEVEMVPEGV